MGRLDINNADRKNNTLELEDLEVQLEGSDLSIESILNAVKSKANGSELAVKLTEEALNKSWKLHERVMRNLDKAQITIFSDSGVTNNLVRVLINLFSHNRTLSIVSVFKVRESELEPILFVAAKGWFSVNVITYYTKRGMVRYQLRLESDDLDYDIFTVIKDGVHSLDVVAVDMSRSTEELVFKYNEDDARIIDKGADDIEGLGAIVKYMFDRYEPETRGNYPFFIDGM